MTIYLVRHAAAGRRNNRNPDDLQRHLDEHGLRQAEAISLLLGARDITTVASSPAPRCVETVTPLAAALGVSVAHDRRLLEGEPLEPAWDLVEKLAADGSDAVLCGHGDLLPELVRRAQLRGMRVPGACGCAKGSVWTLTWDGTGFVSGVYTPVPG
ncbi:MAG TPA: phosphoglycerate mutase family protein [Microthrixaceae bacterium]|nr:phosphoglycerate mutase family protein [Microthrixaceae bacterium]HMT62200.1 phosphoglycerate mutase family protein [Microthrixaceae bacterium]